MTSPICTISFNSNTHVTRDWKTTFEHSNNPGSECDIRVNFEQTLRGKEMSSKQDETNNLR